MNGRMANGGEFSTQSQVREHLISPLDIFQSIVERARLCTAAGNCVSESVTCYDSRLVYAVSLSRANDAKMVAKALRVAHQLAGVYQVRSYSSAVTVSDAEAQHKVPRSPSRDAIGHRIDRSTLRFRSQKANK